MKVIRTNNDLFNEMEKKWAVRGKSRFLSNVLVEGVTWSDNDFSVSTSNCVFSNCNFIRSTLRPDKGVTVFRKCHIRDLETYRVSRDEDEGIVRIYDSEIERFCDFNHHRTDIYSSKINSLASEGFCNLYNCDIDTIRSERGMAVPAGRMKSYGSHIRLLSSRSGLFNDRSNVINFVKFSKNADNTEIYNTIFNYCDMYNLDFRDFVFGTVVFNNVIISDCNFSKCRNLEGSDFSIKVRDNGETEIENTDFGDAAVKRKDSLSSVYYKFSQTVPSAQRDVK